jgi:hypothetical protein
MDSAPLEDVLLMRDEMTNLAWAIERTVESPIERPAQRYLSADSTQEEPADTTPSAELPRYLLSSTVPPNWIPFLPIQQPDPIAPNDPRRVVSRLQKGSVLQPDGSKKVRRRREVLNVRNSLYDEEIPARHKTHPSAPIRSLDGRLDLVVDLIPEPGGPG